MKTYVLKYSIENPVTKAVVNGQVDVKAKSDKEAIANFEKNNTNPNKKFAGIREK
jgi:hypothetical protein